MSGPLLISLDLDGTLLTTKDTISHRTRCALNEAIRQGHKVIISTGRPYRRSKQYYLELGLNTPIINYHGALVTCPVDLKWENLHTPHEPIITKEIIEKAEMFGIKNFFIEILDNKVVVKRYHKELQERFFNSNQLTILPLIENLDYQSTSILFYPHKEESQNLQRYLYKHFEGVIKTVQWGPPWNLVEVLNSNVSKVTGLSHICKKLSIPPENVVSFGDGLNDIEMIKFSGIGVAMKNADSEVKEVADFVTLSNDEDGIAIFLEKMIL